MIGRLLAGLGGRRRVEVPCTVEIEHSHDSLHAHVELDGVEVLPGDTVLVHEAPGLVAYGERLVVARRATVVRGGWLDRLWARVREPFDLTELYEVSFTPRRTL
jgi:hypothetical protein